MAATIDYSSPAWVGNKYIINGAGRYHVWSWNAFVATPGWSYHGVMNLGAIADLLANQSGASPFWFRWADSDA